MKLNNNVDGRSHGLRALIRSAVATVTAIAIVSAFPADASPLQARKSQSFVDSMGVDTHLDWANSIYQTGFSSLIYPSLADLGIKHIRDGVSSWSPTQIANFHTLHDRLGITGLLGVDCMGEIHTGALYPPVVKSAIERYVPGVDAVECVNEPDILMWKDSGGSKRYFQYDNLGGQQFDASYDSTNGWNRGFFDPKSTTDPAHAIVKEAEDLYHIVKGDPALQGVKVCTVPFANPASFLRYSASDVASMNAAGIADCGGGHYYPGGSHADDDSWNHALTWASPGGFIAGSEWITGNKPVYVGETGYHNDTNYVYHDDQGVSERAAGIYVPLLYCEGFRLLPTGSRTYVYEFADDKPDPDMADHERHYGAFLRNDGSKKPAYFAVKSLISILKDPSPAAVYAPGILDLTMSPVPETVHYFLLQSSRGIYYLLLWNDVSVYMNAGPSTKGADIKPPAVPLTLQFAKRCETRVFAPSESPEPSPTRAYTVRTTANTITLNLPAELLIVEIGHG
ncbi:MAG: hypothetical protein P4L33_21225 [Capsulimonadaceae bacterium]|nr:hypothetical protein [Capsulimonadaceae bacterium]